jgi:hypothetical protein
MGMNAHQAIYCAHRDTKNIHVHIAVNRIHPDTNRAIEINKGFDLDPLHRAIAKIEHLQGWQPEPKARYLVLENGEILEVNANRKQQRQPQQRAADFEQRTGEKSAQRIGIEQIAPLIQQANTWQQIHHQLAQLGAKYEPRGLAKVARTTRSGGTMEIQTRIAQPKSSCPSFSTGGENPARTGSWLESVRQ